jgi:hypothetical protein
LIERVKDVQAGQEYELRDIAERLQEEGEAQALRALAKPGRAEEILRPLLARAGDVDAARWLLEKLRASLAAGQVVDAEEEGWAYPDQDAFGWLAGVRDESLLPLLGECLRIAYSRPRPDPFGPINALNGAIRAIGGASALGLYDRLIEDESIPGGSFLRYSRDLVLDDALRAGAAPAVQSALTELGLPQLGSEPY